MKPLLLIAALEAATLLAHAQGTIAFGNSPLTWVGVRLPDGTERHATVEDNLFIGAFYGPAGSSAASLVLAPGLATIGPNPGVMINAPSVFAIPGTEPGQVVSLQIRAWDAALGLDGWREARLNCAGRYYGETVIRQRILGPTIGPGQIIWTSRNSGGLPERFEPLTVVICPEPSTLALAALGGLGWLIFLRRRKDKIALTQGNETTAPDRRS